MSGKQKDGCKVRKSFGVLLITGFVLALGANSIAQASTTYDFATSGAAGFKESIPSDTIPPTANNIPSTAFVATDITAVSSSNNTRYTTPAASGSNRAAVRFVFTIAETPASPSSLTPTWEGNNGGSGTVSVYIWNATLSRYDQIGTTTSASDVNLTTTFTTDAAQYVDGSNRVTMLVVNTSSGQRVATDYVKVDAVQPCTTAANCNDGNVCTNDACTSNICAHTNNTATCADDGNANTNDICNGGICTHPMKFETGQPCSTGTTCNDGNACTTDNCSSNKCAHANASGSCSDGNACTTSDTCSGGACVGGPPRNCDDFNVCTTDSCNPASGCVHTNNNNPCDDGNACSTNDTCAGGVCGVGQLPEVSITSFGVVSGGDITVSESGTDTGGFILHRIGGSNTADLTVNLAITGSATNGVDYLSLGTPATMDRSGIEGIDLKPFDDLIDEDNETVTITVLPSLDCTYRVDAALFPRTATVTILDNDPPPVLSITGRSVLESGSKSGSDKTFATVTLSARSEKAVSVNFATSTGSHTFVKPCVPICRNGICTICTFPCLPSAPISSTATGSPFATCASAGADFIHRSGPLNFPAGTTTQDVNVLMCDDVRIEPDETFFIGLSSPTNATISNINGCGLNDTAVAKILNNDVQSGSFDLTPTDATAAVHDRLAYAFSWTVPDPLNWHDLQLLELRIIDDEGTILWVGFDEASNTFSLFNEAKGEFGKGAAPGSNKHLETPQATLYLADTTVVGSGPTGPSVTLNLSLSFKPQAAGRTFNVEVAASDDEGNVDLFAQAGTLTVTPLNDDGP